MREIICDPNEIAAYLDGELCQAASLRFEQHIRECGPCAADLAEQRRLLCALNFALKDEPEIKLPAEFARGVAARAETDMSGVRHARERQRALWLCMLIALGSSLLLSVTSVSYTNLLSPVVRVGRPILSMAWLIYHALVDVGMSAVVVLRALGCLLISAPFSFGLTGVLLFAVASALLSLLIIDYHRTRITNGNP